MHYSAPAVRASLGFFALGKVVTAVAAIVLLLVLARELPKADFAIYASLQAMVLVVGAVTSFGLNQSTLRYLPEMRAQGQNAAMYALIWRTAGHRLLFSTAGFALSAGALPWLAAPLGLEGRQAWVLAYFGVGTLRLTSQFFSSAMEALLWPRISQYALAAAALLKLLLLALLLATGWLSFPSVVLLELVGELLAAVLLTLGLRYRQRADRQANNGDRGWAQAHQARLTHYGRWNYATTLVTQLASTSPYRLLAPLLLGPEKAALLGLVYGLSDLLQRFLPARMARLLLRSVIVGRQGEAAAATLSGPLALSLRLNLSILALALACAVAAGSGVLATLTAGRYTNAGLLLAAVVAVLGLDVCRVHLDLLASVNERVRAAVGANLGLAAGIGTAVVLTTPCGIWALPIGAAVGQCAAIVLYLCTLRDLRAYRIYAPKALAFVLVAGGAGAAAQAADGWHWSVRLVLAMALLATGAGLLRPLTTSDLRRLRGSPVQASVRSPLA